METSNKVVIITGGIGGIGFITAQYLLRSGVQFLAIFDLPQPDSKVVIHNLNKLKKEFGNENLGFYTCDVTNAQEFRACYETIIGLKNYVDILINVAGILNDNAIDLCINVNFRAVVNCTMIAIDNMRKDKGAKGGVVVNVSSLAGVIDIPFNPVYSATKHAVVSFVRSLRQHNKTLGVRIVCICPGVTDTNLVAFDHLYRGLFDFISPKIVDDYRAQVISQKPDNVALAIVDIIKKGKDGAVWVVKDDEPSFAVDEINDVDKLRIDL